MAILHRQVTDTPGLLSRPDDERNAMELLTLASLQHLPTLVMFVVDLTETCGTSAAVQWKIRHALDTVLRADFEFHGGNEHGTMIGIYRCELRDRFGGKPWLDVISKQDLLIDLLEHADGLPDFSVGDEVRTSLDMARALTREGAIRVSSTTGSAGILHARVLCMITSSLQSHAARLMQALESTICR